MNTYLYRLFDAEERLLYVGITSDVAKRLEEHKRGQPWFNEVFSHTIETLRKRRAAIDIERETIMVEKPRYNKQHNTTRMDPNSRLRHSSYRSDGVLDQRWSSESLVGSYFHSDEKNAWQGVVVAEVAAAIYLIEILDWWSGEAGCQKVIALSEMTDWCFYDDARWMQHDFKRVEAKWEDAKVSKV